MFRQMLSSFIFVFFLAVFASGGAAWAHGGVNHHGPAHPGEAYTAQKIAENIYAYLGKDGGSNSGFIVAPEGVIVIDAQDDSVLATNEMAAIRKVTDKPIRFLISTHHHGDHTGGNPAYEKEGVAIISHRDCRAAMVERQMKGLPILTFDGAIQLYVGGREVRVYHFGWGHTKGDAVIAIPEAGVVFSGDVLFSGKFPYTGDGNHAGWIGSLEHLKGLSATKIVPGHGPVSTNKQVDELTAFFKETMAAVSSMKKAGKSVEDCKKGIDFKKYFDAGWGGGFFDQLPPLIVEWMYKES